MKFQIHLLCSVEWSTKQFIISFVRIRMKYKTNVSQWKLKTDQHEIVTHTIQLILMY